MHSPFIVSDSVTQWTVAQRFLSPWDFPWRNTRVGCHALLQGIFPTQGSNPCLPHCRQIHYAEPLRKPMPKPINGQRNRTTVGTRQHSALRLGTESPSMRVLSPENAAKLRFTRHRRNENGCLVGRQLCWWWYNYDNTEVDAHISIYSPTVLPKYPRM